MAVNNGQATNGFSVSTLTLSNYAVGSESDRVLAIGLVTTNSTSVTHDSANFNTTETGSVVRDREDLNSGIRSRASIWEVLDPSNATANIVGGLSAAATEFGILAVYLDGAANQTAESEADAEDLLEPCEVTLTSLTNGAFCVAIIVGEGSGTPSDIVDWTGATGTTVPVTVEINTSFNTWGGLGHLTADASSETLGFEHSAQNLTYATLVAAGWAPVGGGGSAVPVILQQLAHTG